ncbi:hypothetical protein PAMP_014973 [Pampus punctatissimus]
MRSKRSTLAYFRLRFALVSMKRDLFPLQDKPRLHKWVDNMKREEWTPSRHQYLCSEHFTEDCFDIRWGIRYLKNTAIPTIFPSVEDDGEKVTTIKRSPKAKSGTFDNEATGSNYLLSKRPLILSRTCKNTQSSIMNHVDAEHTAITDPIHVGVFELPLVSDTSSFCHSNNPEIQTAACEIPGDGGRPTSPCLSLSPCDELHSEEQADSTVTVMCCEPPGSFSNGEANVDPATFQAALGQAFSFVPVEIVMDEPAGCFLGDRGPSEEEHVCAYEHSYCRPDMDKDQLWNKILSLHAKILELDRREESTVAKIHTLETEIALLKRDSAVFKEKQKVLEGCISSVLL